MKITFRSSRGLVKRITLFSLSPITNEGEGGRRVVGTQINKMTNSETNLNLLRPLLDLICYNNAAGEKIHLILSLTFLPTTFCELNHWSQGGKINSDSTFQIAISGREGKEVELEAGCELYCYVMCYHIKGICCLLLWCLHSNCFRGRDLLKT